MLLFFSSKSVLYQHNMEFSPLPPPPPSSHSPSFFLYIYIAVTLNPGQNDLPFPSPLLIGGIWSHVVNVTDSYWSSRLVQPGTGYLICSQFEEIMLISAFSIRKTVFKNVSIFLYKKQIDQKKMNFMFTIHLRNNNDYNKQITSSVIRLILPHLPNPISSLCLPELKGKDEIPLLSGSFGWYLPPHAAH